MRRDVEAPRRADRERDGSSAIPATVAELTPAWLGHVLDADVAAVDVIDAHSGTTGRAKIRVTAGADVPDTLFVKLQPFDADQRAFLARVGLGVSEARFYAAGDRWQPADVGRRATERTTQAIVDLEVLGLLGERLGAG